MLSFLFQALPQSVVALVIVAFAFSATGCAGTIARIFEPYKVEIQQGNFISREQVAGLREGMTRDQVRFVLGSPMLQPVFRGDRWDYLFYVRRTSGEVVERKFTAWFKDDRLVKWEGDEMPSERPREFAGDAPAKTDPSAADVKPDGASPVPVPPPTQPTPAPVPSSVPGRTPGTGAGS